MDDGPDGKSGKSEKPAVDSNSEKKSADGPQDEQTIQQAPASNNEKLRGTSESDSTANNSDGVLNSSKKETETVPIPKDANEEEDEDAVFAHLPDHEKAILKEQLHIPDVKVSFVGLYRYASTNDLIVLAVSAICSIAAGAIMPLFTVCCLDSLSCMWLLTLFLDRSSLVPWQGRSKISPWVIFRQTSLTAPCRSTHCTLSTLGLACSSPSTFPL